MIGTSVPVERLINFKFHNSKSQTFKNDLMVINVISNFNS